MAEYRAYKVSTVSGSVALGKGTAYPNVWGVMRGEGNPSGSVALAGGGVINLTSIDNHQIFPCYPVYLTISSGAVIILE
jgi:hypothetical protein